MTIRKNNPNSEFWQAAEAASKRVEFFPPWKLGIICGHPDLIVVELDTYEDCYCPKCGHGWKRDL